VEQTNDGRANGGPHVSAGTPTEGGSGVERTVLLGGILAVLAVFAAVTVGIGAVVDDYAVGAVLGAFCAMWGGIGFGVMLSGALALLRDEVPPHDRPSPRAPDVGAREPAVVASAGASDPRRP
jgi:hypothetical protein